jgi:hypothetical protein
VLARCTNHLDAGLVVMKTVLVLIPPGYLLKMANASDSFAFSLVRLMCRAPLSPPFASTLTSHIQ